MKKFIVSLVAVLALVGCTKNLESDFEYDKLHSQVLLACQDKSDGSDCNVSIDGGPAFDGTCISYRRTQMLCHANDLKQSMGDPEGVKELCEGKELGQSCSTYEVTGKPRPGYCLADSDGELFCASSAHRGSQ